MIKEARELKNMLTMYEELVEKVTAQNKKLKRCIKAHKQKEAQPKPQVFHAQSQQLLPASNSIRQLNSTSC
jgi:hypothetical protein